MVPSVYVLIKPSSSICNMSCDYCFYCDEASKRTTSSFGFMSEATLKNVIRKTLPQAEKSACYAFQGGEPTLRGIDFYETAMMFQHKYNKNNVPVSNVIQTNGYAINDDWCRFFKKYHFLVGVSVDGLFSIHDSYRHSGNGGGSFERVLQSIELLKHYNVEFNILSVVTRRFASNIKDIYAFYRHQNWNYQQYIACLDPLGEAHGEKQYSLLPEHYGRFLIDLFDLWYADYKKGCQPYIRQFENYVGILAGFQAEACDQKGKCSVQNVVEADGSVYPCDFYMTDEFLLGNFNDHRLDDINKKREQICFIQNSEKLDIRCHNCQYLHICRGGCMRNRDYRANSDSYVNYYCEAYKMFFDYAIDKLTQISESIIV